MFLLLFSRLGGFTALKIGIIIAVITWANLNGYLIFIVGSYVLYQMLNLGRFIGFGLAARLYFLPIAVALLGVAALKTERLDLTMSIGLAAMCVAAYAWLRPSGEQIHNATMSKIEEINGRS